MSASLQSVVISILASSPLPSRHAMRPGISKRFRRSAMFVNAIPGLWLSITIATRLAYHFFRFQPGLEPRSFTALYGETETTDLQILLWPLEHQRRTRPVRPVRPSAAAIRLETGSTEKARLRRDDVSRRRRGA